MNIFQKHRLATLLLAAGTLTLTFTACSDNTADLANTPSTTDPKQWNLDGNMDTSVKPGDDFARYCWGKWYDAQDEPLGDISYGTIAEAEAVIQQKVKALDNKEGSQLTSDMSRLDEDEANLTKLRQRIQDLNELRTASPAEVAKELGKFLASGKNSLLTAQLVCYGEKNYISVFKSALVSNNLATDMPQPFYLFSDWLIDLGLDEEKAKEVANDGTSSDFITKSSDSENIFEEYPSGATAKKRKTRVKDTDANQKAVCEAFCEGMGIKSDQLITDSLSTQVGMGGFIVLNASHIVDMMMCYEATDILLASKKALDQYRSSYPCEEEAFLERVVGTLLQYPMSKAFCEKYCTAELRNMTFEMMEDMRTTFAKRLENIEWMTTTTKEAAKSKLYAMKFFACYPDKWLDAGLPTLKGNSLYEDIQTLRQTFVNLEKELLAVNPREDMFNVAIVQGFPTYLVNCFYNPETNTVNIFAPFVMSPFYSSENSDATLYAVGTVLGHELTHGFDSQGALYGPKGEDINWWTVSDKQEYDTRTQLLVDCYNHLPGYMNCPGSCFTDGKKTLTENIADLGGVELALQAYTEKLEQQGYYGDELAKQQKRFFQAYANLWRSKISEEENIKHLKSTDMHANAYTRILGSTMNCNRWYELYGVQWGDKYYLHPEKRTHIW